MTMIKQVSIKSFEKDKESYDSAEIAVNNTLDKLKLVDEVAIFVVRKNENGDFQNLFLTKGVNSIRLLEMIGSLELSLKEIKKEEVDIVLNDFKKVQNDY